jgi:hypothetical protein
VTAVVRGAALALALLFAARGAEAQGAPVTPVGLATPGAATTIASAVARLEGIADPRVRRAVADVLADADRRGLPLEPLVAKALEGVEKEAPPPRIEAAVRGMALRLATSRDALQPAVGEREIAAGADALALGVPAETLRSFRGLSRRRSTAVALGVLAQLVSRGVPVPEATRAVGRLLQRRASDGQLLAMGQEVQRDLAGGTSPVTALDLRFKALIATLPTVSAPAAAEALSNGNGTPGRAGPNTPTRPTAPPATPVTPAGAPAPKP